MIIKQKAMDDMIQDIETFFLFFVTSYIICQFNELFSLNIRFHK